MRIADDDLAKALKAASDILPDEVLMVYLVAVTKSESKGSIKIHQLANVQDTSLCARVLEHALTALRGAS